jgi:hypothetical protein
MRILRFIHHSGSFMCNNSNYQMPNNYTGIYRAMKLCYSIFIVFLSSHLFAASSQLALKAGISCKSLRVFSKINETLPCSEIPSCQSSTKSMIVVNELSNGHGYSKSKSTIELCHDENYLQIISHAYNQSYFPTKQKYQKCNDAIFYLDVAEFFISPWKASDDSSNGPHCYSELDISPWNVMYESGIYNPNLNHTGCVNSLIDCTASGILHESEVSSQSWTAKLSFPWSVLNCPAGCPQSPASANDYTCGNTRGNIYRANFYRINELNDVSQTQCSKSDCEYMAWSPTFVDPPSFHEPKYFGFLVLV